MSYKSTIKKILLFSLTRLLSFDAYRVVGWLIYLYLSCSVTGQGPRKFIYARKSVFNEEMAALIANTNISTVRVDRDLLRTIIHHFYNVETKYHLATENALKPRLDLKLSFEDFFRLTFLPALQSLGVTTWASCDFIYYYERPFQQECINNGIRSFVFLKECYKSPIQHVGWYFYLSENYKNIPVDSIAVYNLRMKNTLVNSKVINEDQVRVLGSLRMDALLKRQASKTPQALRNRVIFFESSPKAGFPNFGRGTLVKKALNHFDYGDGAFEKIQQIWRDVSEKIFEDSISFALSNPSLEVVYKCKTGTQTNHQLDGKHQPRNWRMVVGGSSVGLLKSARFCVGFNTSALLEAVFFRIPTLSPALDEQDSELCKSFLMDYGKAVGFYKCTEDLSVKNIAEIEKKYLQSDPYTLLSSASSDGAFPKPVEWNFVRQTLG